jgi:hypothetical protein
MGFSISLLPALVTQATWEGGNTACTGCLHVTGTGGVQVGAWHVTMGGLLRLDASTTERFWRRQSTWHDFKVQAPAAKYLGGSCMDQDGPDQHVVSTQEHTPDLSLTRPARPTKVCHCTLGLSRPTSPDPESFP